MQFIPNLSHDTRQAPTRLFPLSWSCKCVLRIHHCIYCGLTSIKICEILRHFIKRYVYFEVYYGKGYENRIQFSGDVNTGDISITINAVTMEDNGTYACSVRLRNDPPRQTATLSLFVLVAPSKPECNILGTTEYGQTINLTCISHEGSPKPRYTWQSFNVQNEPRVLQTTEGEQITLKNISADTSGFYICTSTNIVGKEFCNMTVSVVPPSMNIALYAGIIGGAVAAIIVIGILAYCCCCRADKDTDYEMTEREDRHEPSKEIRRPMPSSGFAGTQTPL
uniref:Glycoprotein A33 n=2 Tax=Bubo bubo TaxID=30461 RepID=A0A8C0IBE0_BUBBB